MKARPLSRRKMMPPTPLQHSCSSSEEEQEHFEVEDQIRSVRDRTVIARTKSGCCKNDRYSTWKKVTAVTVEVEELEDLLGPEDVDC